MVNVTFYLHLAQVQIHSFKPNKTCIQDSQVALCWRPFCQVTDISCTMFLLLTQDNVSGVCGLVLNLPSVTLCTAPMQMLGDSTVHSETGNASEVSILIFCGNVLFSKCLQSNCQAFAGVQSHRGRMRFGSISILKEAILA